jgi:hypothetical protein
MKKQQTFSRRIRTAARWSMVQLGLDSFLLRLTSRDAGHFILSLIMGASTLLLGFEIGT